MYLKELACQKGYQFGKGIVEQELASMFEPKWIRTASKDSGLNERERKIDPHIMFLTLAIGYSSLLYRTLTELKREYEARGNASVSDSSSSAVVNSLKSISILSENTSEMKTLKTGPWIKIKNMMLLIDLRSRGHNAYPNFIPIL